MHKWNKINLSVRTTVAYLQLLALTTNHEFKSASDTSINIFSLSRSFCHQALFSQGHFVIRPFCRRALLSRPFSRGPFVAGPLGKTLMSPDYPNVDLLHQGRLCTKYFLKVSAFAIGTSSSNAIYGLPQSIYKLSEQFAVCICHLLCMQHACEIS
jgi:hypothetical protein